MKIYQLTHIGWSLAKTPVPSPTPARRVCYYLKHRGGSATDDTIRNHIGNDGEFREAIKRLSEVHAIQSISE